MAGVVYLLPGLHLVDGFAIRTTANEGRHKYQVSKSIICGRLCWFEPKFHGN